MTRTDSHDLIRVWVDDSDGEMGGLLERLQELHLVACGAARPDPDELAARLCPHGARTEAQLHEAAGQRAMVTARA